MVAITVDHIPKGMAYSRRPGNAMKPTAITIHSTGNATALARGERGWLVNPTNKREASWHYVVDATMCIEAVPPNERAYHAGDGLGPGNTASIGIEMVHAGDRAKVLQRTKELTVQLMIKYGITKVVRHYDWTKKNCPAILNADGKWTAWKAFHADIMAMYKAATEKPDVIQVSNPVTTPAVKTTAVKKPAPVKKPVPAKKAAPKTPAINSIGTIVIVNVARACYIVEKPSAAGKVLATISRGGKIQISGSVPGWWEVIYNGRRAYINDKYGKRV